MNSKMANRQMPQGNGRQLSTSGSTRPTTSMCREVQRIDILFKEPLATFKAGDVLSGTVLMDVVMDFKTKGVQLLLNGMARAQWDEQRAYTKGSAGKLSHRNAEVYMDEMVELSSRSDTLVPGHYNWPFSVRLPLHLPASFHDHRWGRVHYTAKVIVERPWKAALEFGRLFTVLGMLDLNTEPDAMKPVENTQEAMLGASCFKSGPVSGHVMVERRGFAIGQSVPFNVRIENNSRKRLNIRMVLSQMIAVPSGPGKDFEVPVEIIIGTVPLRKRGPGAASIAQDIFKPGKRQ